MKGRRWPDAWIIIDPNTAGTWGFVMSAGQFQICGLLGFFLLAPVAAPAQETALDRYIAVHDAVYAYAPQQIIEGDGYRTHVLLLTSQQWRDASEVDRPLWRHTLKIVVPTNVKHRTGLLWIGGGENTDLVKAAIADAPERIIRFATETGSVVAELGQVPNQPLTLLDTPEQPRVEDDLIAASRMKFIATGDEFWLVRLAMVKSGVRAMDAVQDYLLTEQGGGHVVERFVVAGGSKRGWTTWLVGAVDDRVSAIMPLVIDALNSVEVTKHHFEAYGFFSSALEDYVQHGLFPRRIGTLGYQAALAIEDPYNYRHRARLKIPKFVLNASGDEFFLPDNSQFYYAQLPEEKRLRYVPNAKHNLADSDAIESLLAFYEAVLNDRPRPAYTWTTHGPGQMRVLSKDQPAKARLWQATNPEARDFRVDSIGKAYSSSDLEEHAPGVYLAKVEKPPRGYTAYFVELEFPSGGKYPFKFSTEVRVIPEEAPFHLPELLGPR